MQREDLLYVEVDDRQIVIHNKKIVITGSLTAQLGILLPCLGIEKARVNTFVNKENIWLPDKKTSRIYFDKDDETLFVKVSRDNRYKFFW